MDDPVLWIALRHTPGLRRNQANALLARYGAPSRIFDRPAGELAAARDELERARRLGLVPLTRDAPDFPAALAHIPDPPLVLYLRGRLPPGPALAIVGSRRATERGRESARGLAAGVARAGGVVVSGLAYGIDAAAHRGALEGGGPTLVVLASGADQPTPTGHRALARQILDTGGGWLSEYPPGAPARAFQFPERNRLISGIADACLVVEARERSGSLWTARHALEQGRWLGAVPGPIDTDACRGSNGLLRDGAAPVLELADVLDPLGLRAAPVAQPNASTVAQRVLDQLANGPRERDALGRSLGIGASELAARLVELELDGRITCDGTRVALRRG
jgi:DNA processing protein